MDPHRLTQHVRTDLHSFGLACKRLRGVTKRLSFTCVEVDLDATSSPFSTERFAHISGSPALSSAVRGLRIWQEVCEHHLSIISTALLRKYLQLASNLDSLELCNVDLAFFAKFLRSTSPAVLQRIQHIYISNTQIYGYSDLYPLQLDQLLSQLPNVRSLSILDEDSDTARSLSWVATLPLPKIRVPRLYLDSGVPLVSLCSDLHVLTHLQIYWEDATVLMSSLTRRPSRFCLSSLVSLELLNQSYNNDGLESLPLFMSLCKKLEHLKLPICGAPGKRSPLRSLPQNLRSLEITYLHGHYGWPTLLCLHSLILRGQLAHLQKFSITSDWSDIVSGCIDINLRYRGHTRPMPLDGLDTLNAVVPASVEGEIWIAERVLELGTELVDRTKAFCSRLFGAIRAVLLRQRVNYRIHLLGEPAEARHTL